MRGGAFASVKKTKLKPGTAYWVYIDGRGELETAFSYFKRKNLGV